jgi:hypothetical protein
VSRRLRHRFSASVHRLRAGSACCRSFSCHGSRRLRRHKLLVIPRRRQPRARRALRLGGALTTAARPPLSLAHLAVLLSLRLCRIESNRIKPPPSSTCADRRLPAPDTGTEKQQEHGKQQQQQQQGEEELSSSCRRQGRVGGVSGSAETDADRKRRDTFTFGRDLSHHQAVRIGLKPVFHFVEVYFMLVACFSER